MKKAKIFLVIMLLLVLSSCGMSKEKQGKEILNASFDYANERYDEKNMFTKKNTNGYVYQDEDYYYVQLINQQEEEDSYGKKAMFVIHDFYRIKKHDKFSISKEDFEVYNNRDEVESKPFIYDEENIIIEE
ncbi:MULTISPECIES: hypothetical protein [Vagococcus]|uniref:DUF4467 domain-containing protein n=1 Tax=Vagococcus fluvialis bH819 TaxID=1255619 RepID=A0A1X6WL45_9ENTE|nr:MULTISPECIES: hypothetical protein [Vagococcus]SLM84988.1 hypothetical protein FM121_02755 [Vagococcus fluvialis bH819]HCM88595.1 hypothetical protein [Vagococcus sp.]